jgi:hypothetical protein
MKTKRIKSIFALTIFSTTLIFGCANTRYTEYRGDGIIQGKGGSVRTVSGVEIWENGEPNRKFKILGFAEDNRQGGPIANAVWDSAITKLVKEKGGNAVIVSSTTKVLSGIDVKSGVAQYAKQSKIMIVKYID